MDLTNLKKGTWLGKLCTNSECGYHIGGRIVREDNEVIEEYEFPCIMCDSKVKYVPYEESFGHENWKKAENHLKFEQAAHEKTREYLREHFKKFRKLTLDIYHNGPRKLDLDECRLLDVCRVCLKDRCVSEDTGSFVLNYGEEYAHQKCLMDIGEYKNKANLECVYVS